MLHNIVARPEVATNWISLFSWSSSILQPAKRGGKRHNLTNVVKKWISEFSTTEPSVPVVAGSVGHRSLSPAELIAHSIRSKLEDGNVRAAIRLLRLQEKHPPASPTDKPFADPHKFTPLAVDEAAVQKAVMVFPSGSSSGPDGLRPQHLKELVQCRESGPGFLTALTGFVNLVLSGRCPADVAPIFFRRAADSPEQKIRRDLPHSGWFDAETFGIEVCQRACCLPVGCILQACLTRSGLSRRL